MKERLRSLTDYFCKIKQQIISKILAFLSSTEPSSNKKMLAACFSTALLFSTNNKTEYLMLILQLLITAAIWCLLQYCRIFAAAYI